MKKVDEAEGGGHVKKGFVGDEGKFQLKVLWETKPVEILKAGSDVIV